MFEGGAFSWRNSSWLLIGECSPLVVPSLLHVDADGGRGPLCCTGQGLCQ